MSETKSFNPTIPEYDKRKAFIAQLKPNKTILSFSPGSSKMLFTHVTPSTEFPMFIHGINLKYSGFRHMGLTLELREEDDFLNDIKIVPVNALTLEKHLQLASNEVREQVWQVFNR